MFFLRLLCMRSSGELKEGLMGTLGQVSRAVQRIDREMLRL